MKFLSWNVNGLNNIVRKGLVPFLRKEQPDIVGLQETKSPAKMPHIALEGYHLWFNNAPRKGYSGTAVFSRHEPVDVTFGIGVKEHDQEGRVITLRFKKFYFVTVYVPNSQRGLTRLDYRQRWDADFRDYLKQLDRKAPVIACGDFNVAHTPIDLANPQSNENNHGFTIQERDGFSRLLEAGFIDAFRILHPNEPGHYTWWSPRNNCRQRNIGWRIDYFLISKRLRSALVDCAILKNVKGSDHCPIALIMKDEALL